MSYIDFSLSNSSTLYRILFSLRIRVTLNKTGIENITIVSSFDFIYKLTLNSLKLKKSKHELFTIIIIMTKYLIIPVRMTPNLIPFKVV